MALLPDQYVIHDESEPKGPIQPEDIDIEVILAPPGITISWEAPESPSGFSQGLRFQVILTDDMENTYTWPESGTSLQTSATFSEFPNKLKFVRINTFNPLEPPAYIIIEDTAVKDDRGVFIKFLERVGEAILNIFRRRGNGKIKKK